MCDPHVLNPIIRGKATRITIKIMVNSNFTWGGGGGVWVLKIYNYFVSSVFTLDTLAYINFETTLNQRLTLMACLMQIYFRINSQVCLFIAQKVAYVL